MGVPRTLIVLFLALVLDLACPLMLEVREGSSETTVQVTDVMRPRRAVRLAHSLSQVAVAPIVQSASLRLESIAHPASRWEGPYRSVRGTPSANPQPPAASPDDH